MADLERSDIATLTTAARALRDPGDWNTEAIIQDLLKLIERLEASNG